MARQIFKDKAKAHGLLNDISGDPEVFLEMLNVFYKEMFEVDLTKLMGKDTRGVLKVSEDETLTHRKESMH